MCVSPSSISLFLSVALFDFSLVVRTKEETISSLLSESLISSQAAITYNNRRSSCLFSGNLKTFCSFSSITINYFGDSYSNIYQQLNAYLLFQVPTMVLLLFFFFFISILLAIYKFLISTST